MSWQTYVDDHLMCEIEGNHLSAAAIIGHDGSVWAQSATFPQVSFSLPQTHLDLWFIWVVESWFLCGFCVILRSDHCSFFFIVSIVILIFGFVCHALELDFLRYCAWLYDWFMTCLDLAPIKKTIFIFHFSFFFYLRSLCWFSICLFGFWVMREWAEVLTFFFFF